jgi:hypothetical protein
MAENFPDCPKEATEVLCDDCYRLVTGRRMVNPNKTLEFIPSGRGKAQCAPDPKYPNGIALPAPPDCVVSCKVMLPYPAPECGVWKIACTTCGCSMMVSAAGRPDDPVSCRVPCIIKEGTVQ